MKKGFASIFLICLLIFSSSQEKELGPHDYSIAYNNAERIFSQAEHLTSSNELDDKTQKRQDQLYDLALTLFHKVADKTYSFSSDSIRFHSFIKIGLINHYFERIAVAKGYYLAAIQLKPKLPTAQDSFLFKPYLFLGGILYDAHEFDSAFLCYQDAERIQSSYRTALGESQRLYNKLGAMYYETGNYTLAKTYFEKALSSLSPTQSSFTSLMINYKINIASILVKLQEYEEAKSLYESLLPYKIYENEIWHNLGIINNHQGKFAEAVQDFRRINYSTGNKNVDLDYNLAVSFSNLNESDSVDLYIRRAISENRKVNGGQKNTAYGLVLQLLGDRAVDHRKYSDAVNYYQQAIVQFDIPFNDTESYRNPNQFSGIFSYINLFNALSAKAEAFNRFYEADRQIKKLEAALDAYRAAFKLVDYVGKTYESDDARFFLNAIKYSAHGKPIDLCLRLYGLTNEKKYLEEAYLFDQRNKASILSFNFQLQELQRQGGISSQLIQKQSSLKTSITRLSLNASQVTNRDELEKTNAAINDLEIQLASVQQVLNRDPRYAQLQPADQIPSVSALQNKILDNNTALISYHLSPNELLAFVISTRGFHYYRQAINEDFYSGLRSYSKFLHEVNDEGATKQNNEISKYLYTILIKPLLSFTGKCERLVIIPDDELNSLPFEALKNEKDGYLIEFFSIQYQYSTAILTSPSARRNIAENKILAFAPFTTNDSKIGDDILPYSENEVADLDGQVFTGKSATKKNFLSGANHYGVIHLATHAKVNDSVPLQSYISFYPDSNGSTSRLYAREVYNLRLDSTKLIILSACETGAGQLVRGEGLMSLSRSFAYAGCHNIITSLWKAEDKTTAFLTKRLHFYLQKSDPYDQALRKAKLDLLSSNQIGPRFRNPRYWAHLVFIGEYQPGRTTFYWPWIAGIILVLVTAFVLLKKSPAQAGRIMRDS